MPGRVRRAEPFAQRRQSHAQIFKPQLHKERGAGRIVELAGEKQRQFSRAVHRRLRASDEQAMRDVAPAAAEFGIGLKSRQQCREVA
ncbi:hypothetical protein HNO88_003971 [Novosphingobium chloroacetimidivorans]|uniref:Uncharacterized protein n=1 Tax=Novosphingobium chloroacetimidivorans TaxID=1428314 RepID=A0A7W7KD65_9SPHN|nr:hypothetical protein [Novosphingobium chloroacetimidivorans]MBB4860627.1 hypothetical protein [Novosphingobium chloroacetimidivorans]